MYIPFTYFGPDSNLCISASGGTISFLTSGSDLYKVHSFTEPGSHTYQVHSGSAPHKLVLVGGGGSGGISVFFSNTSGGGGAGGFLFLENLPFSSGSYNLTVGGGFQSTVTIDGYTCSIIPSLKYDFPVNYKGGDTTFNYLFTPTSPDPNYNIPSSTLTAKGGGGGASVYYVCSSDGTSKGYDGTSGASGGGGSMRADGSASGKKQNPGYALTNIGLPPHGFDGGDIIGTNPNAGSGGGGSSSKGSPQNKLGFRTGGDGVNLLSYIGINQVVCQGGTGGSGGGLNAAGTNTSGSGGSGAIYNNGGNLTGTKGNNGLVIVMYKICADEL